MSSQLSAYAGEFKRCQQERAVRFHRMELLPRLGVVQAIPELARQVAVLREMLAAGQGRFTKALSHPYFRKWGAYTGLMLERDWRDPQRRIYDLTFRSLLILHYAEI